MSDRRITKTFTEFSERLAFLSTTATSATSSICMIH